jgi:C-terminal processing protease CtpA/Prc
MRTHRFVPVLVALALALPGLASAQEETRERQPEEARQKARIEEARARAEEAQRGLARALEELRAARADEAARALRDVSEAVRRAEQELRERTFLGQIMLRELPEGNIMVRLGSRPQMGVILSANTRNDSLGATLQAVTPGRPADQAGLKAGDVIIEANGERLARTSRRDRAPRDKLVEIIGDLEDGDTLTVRYRRGSETGSAKVVVREPEGGAWSYAFGGDSGMRFMEPTVRALAAPEIALFTDSVRSRIRERVPVRELAATTWFPFGWLDMELTELNPELGEYFGATKGILVVRGPDSEDLDLQGGDVILNIDGREPTSPSHALRIMRSYEPGETMSVEIMRNKARRTIQITVPERDRGFFWSDGGKDER